jgi:hypothetical protein
LASGNCFAYMSYEYGTAKANYRSLKSPLCSCVSITPGKLALTVAQ